MITHTKTDDKNRTFTAGDRSIRVYFPAGVTRLEMDDALEAQAVENIPAIEYVDQGDIDIDAESESESDEPAAETTEEEAAAVVVADIDGEEVDVAGDETADEQEQEE